MPTDIRTNRFEDDGQGMVISQCCSCKHLWAGESFECEAFPAGIPTPIILNEVDHRKPVTGDHGIRFEPDAGVSAAYIKRLDSELAVVKTKVG